MRLVDEANTIGLFGGKRAILVSGANKCPLSAIEPLLSVPPMDAIVVLEGGDLNKSNPVRVAVERSRSALAVPCYADEARGLDAVIDTVLRDFGMTIDREARQLLVARIGVDRRVSQREIEKVATYAGSKQRVEWSDVEAIVGDAAARDIDDIVDGVFSGAVCRVDLAFGRLRSAGEDSGVMLGFVVRHALMLLVARQGIDQGQITTSEAAKKVRGVTFRRLANVETALSRWGSANLIKCIGTLSATIAQVRINPALADELATRALWNLTMSSGR